MTSRSPAAARAPRSPGRAGPGPIDRARIGGSSIVTAPTGGGQRTGSRGRTVRTGPGRSPMELGELVLAAVELVLDERVHVVVPDAAQRRLVVEARAHEVRVPDLQVRPRSARRRSSLTRSTRSATQTGPSFTSSQQRSRPLHRAVVRHEGHEVEPPAQCGVGEGDGAVRRVHRADEVQVRGRRSPRPAGRTS